jgi:hypothetical protein
MKFVSYQCEKCNKIIKKSYNSNEKVLFTVSCDCGNNAIRLYKNIVSQKEDENVSAAIQKMLFSKLPSNVDKRIY